MTDVPVIHDRPYGRQPVALKSLAGNIGHRLNWALREANAIDCAVHVKAFWLRQEWTHGMGEPDYDHAYVWMAPVVMSFALCEQIEPIIAKWPGAVRTGLGGDPPEKRNALRPFVYAVIDLYAMDKLRRS